MSRHQYKPQPHEVFTPGGLPLGEHNVYSPRSVPESALDRYRKRGQIPVIFGDFGVGKTSLVRKYFETDDLEGRLVYFPSASGLSVSAIFERVLEVLEYEVQTETVDTKGKSAEGGLDKVLRAVASKTSGRSTKKTLVVSAPTDVGMLGVIDEARLTIVVDEMHRATKEFRAGLAGLIKAVKTSGKSYPVIVIVGTTVDAEHLVVQDPGIDRYIKEVTVPLMRPEESRYIVTEGFRRLELGITDELVARIVEAAVGAPTIVHALCLDAAETALEAARSHVTEDDCRKAVHAYLQDHGRRLASAYLKAIETIGPKKYRKQILHAVANTDNDYATMEDVRSRVSLALAEETPSTALSGPLRDLKTAPYGSVLQDVERVVGGNRVHNLTAFTDPMMKSFIRFMGHLDQTELMPSSNELEKIKVSGGLSTDLS